MPIVKRLVKGSPLTHAEMDGNFDYLAYSTSENFTGNYTAVLADAGKVRRAIDATAQAFTVPTNATAAFPIGSNLIVRQVGAGLTSLVAASGVTLNGATAIGGQNKSVVLIKVATNEWDVYGGDGTAQAALIFEDTFDRANTSNLVGSTTSDGLKVWASGGADSAAIGITSNQAYQASGSTGHYAIATIPTGTRNIDVSVTLGSAVGNGMYLCLAISNNQNTINILLKDCSIGVNVGGSSSLTVPGSGTSVAGDVIRCVLNGTSLTVTRNGAAATSTNSISSSLTANNIGLQVYEDAGVTRIASIKAENI